jgi:hypothetical protein
LAIWSSVKKRVLAAWKLLACAQAAGAPPAPAALAAGAAAVLAAGFDGRRARPSGTAAGVLLRPSTSVTTLPSAAGSRGAAVFE